MKPFPSTIGVSLSREMELIRSEIRHAVAQTAKEEQMKKLTANDIRIVARAAYDEAEESLEELEGANSSEKNSGKKRRMLLAHTMLEQADILASVYDLKPYASSID